MTLLPVFMGLVSFMYINLYPDLIISKKIRELEKNLLFALRHLQIQVKSGIPLFDGLVSISQGNYGLISNEFRDCVKKISTGEPEINSLEELVFKNPSIFFRRVIWQISNAMRTGADLGNTLDAIVDNLSNEQKVAIRRYGSQLNPLSMMYMMTAVIMPSLGITFLILLSTFSGMPISEFLFWFILCILIVFQFSFVGVVKSRRPTIEL
jgi:flagellar protein FlaJ